MGHPEEAIDSLGSQIFKKGDGFALCRTVLEFALIKEDCLGYVFHDIDWEEANTTPARRKGSALRSLGQE